MKYLMKFIPDHYYFGGLAHLRSEHNEMVATTRLEF